MYIPAAISLSILKFCLAAESLFTMPSLTVCLASFHLSFDMYILSGLSLNNIYQQSGDAKNPYFVQYSADVSEGAPVITSWTNMKINILIKYILKPLNTHFNTFLIELFSATSDNIINLYVFVLYNYYKTCSF